MGEEGRKAGRQEGRSAAQGFWAYLHGKKERKKERKKEQAKESRSRSRSRRRRRTNSLNFSFGRTNFSRDVRTRMNEGRKEGCPIPAAAAARSTTFVRSSTGECSNRRPGLTLRTMPLKTLKRRRPSVGEEGIKEGRKEQEMRKVRTNRKLIQQFESSGLLRNETLKMFLFTTFYVIKR